MTFGDTDPGTRLSSGTPSGERVPSRHEAFEAFVVISEPAIRRALVAAYGGHAGREATADALAYAWEHWDRVADFDNLPGYLYRVGQSRARRRSRRPLFARADNSEPLVEPGLRKALLSLSPRQRVAVVLVHGYGWTLREVAELTGTRPTTVQNHLERAMTRLRRALKADTAPTDESAQHDPQENSRSNPS